MANIKISQELIDMMATQEAEVLLEGLRDPSQRKNPAFLAKVRQFLKDNHFITTVETEGVKEIIREHSNIPEFKDLVQ